MIIFDLIFAAIFLGTVALLLRRHPQAPQRPTVLTMPPEGTLERQSARWGGRAAQLDYDCGPNSDARHAEHIAAAYLVAAKEERNA